MLAANTLPDTKVASLPLCSACKVRELCFGQGAGRIGLQQLDQAVERRFWLDPGSLLYCIGDPFKSLFAIRSGCLKSSLHTAAGHEQVAGFHIAGDIVGVGGISTRNYIFTLTALERSEICEIPFERLEELAHRIPRVNRNLVETLARYQERGYAVGMLLRERNADARLAGFLLDFSRRLATRDRDPASFRLPMSRSDLASHLALNASTISKAFARLEQRGIAQVTGRAIKLTNVNGLRAIAANRA
jgi:CRP/FNR family transcriptional regulator, anaerobic regulatory protein